MFKGRHTSREQGRPLGTWADNFFSDMSIFGHLARRYNETTPIAGSEERG